MPKFTVLKHYKDRNSGARHMAGEGITLSDPDRINALKEGGYIGAPEKAKAETADAPKAESADWSLKMEPREYLERYPKGKHAETARKIVGE